MKWGKYLNVVVNETPDWAPSFINYKRLKGVLKELWSDQDEPVSVAASPSAAPAPTAPVHDLDEDDSDDDEQLATSLSAQSIATNDPGEIPADQTLGATPREDVPLQWNGLLPDGVAADQGFLDKLNAQVLDQSPQSAIFINALNIELAKISAFFVKKSQEAYTKLDMVASTDDFAYADRLMAQINAMVSKLREFSTVNYTGTVKILKKHDKASGVFLRAIYVSQVLSKQSFHTDMGRLLLAVDAREKAFNHDSDDENSQADTNSRRRGVGARPASMPGYYYRDLNNDVRSLGLVKKEALCVVVREDGHLMAVREGGTTKLLKAKLESGETTADAAVRAIYEATGVTASVREAIGEYMSTTRKGTIYDAYLLKASEVLENWDMKSEVTRVWVTVEEALGSMSDVSSVRVLRKVFDAK